MDGYKHYIRIDANNIVIHRYSDEFETAQAGDICVNQDGGRHYNDPYTNEREQFIYKWDGANQIPRTQAELDTEWAARPPSPPTLDEQIAQLKAEKEALKQQVSEVNGNFAAFTDFYFTKFPDQA